MGVHLRYLRYVLLHKAYVFVGGLAIRRLQTVPPVGWGAWLWRLLVHDRSKFRPSEWRAYATMFYADDANEWIAKREREFALYHLHNRAQQVAEARWGEEKKRRLAAFQRAWLLHQHRNPHHWQHWVLREDSGKTLLLLPEAWIVDEMVADWLGAGTKILAWPSLAECVGETIKWYMANRVQIQLRERPRERVEGTLHALAAKYGLVDLAYQVHVARAGRGTISVPAAVPASRR